MATSAAIWNWLVCAERWGEWYGDAPAVAYVNQLRAELRAGSVFTWQSRGTTLTATVIEYVPGQRLAWAVQGLGIQAYHSWLLRETATGCQLITQQRQVGWRGALSELLRPQHLFNYQQAWLLALSRQVLRGGPPYVNATGGTVPLATQALVVQRGR